MASEPLQTYWAKRDFRRTAEPRGARKRPATGHRYLIQKHAARRLHYDFRLEHNGVLLSWATPKGPSLDPADKRLAVHVEDHPVEYGDFEGTIPKGQYGGGTVMLWDEGSWEPYGDVDEGLAKGKLSFVLHGERLHGKWALVRMHGRGGPRDRGDNWLLIKELDDEIRPGEGEALVNEALTSVKTGRTMEEIAQGDDVWISNRADDAPAVKRPAGKLAKAKPEPGTKPRKPAAASTRKAASGAKKKSAAGAVKIPAFVAPQLATLVEAPPSAGDWLHEIKFDGYRAVASLGGGQVVIRTRTGLDWTDKFHSLVAPLAALPCTSALLDGEVAVADAEGHTDFGALQNALSAGHGNFGYYLFDLLYLDGEDWRERPLIERKQQLENLLQGAGSAGPLFYSSHLTGSAKEVFEHACDLHLEGIVSKRAADPYRSGRTSSWLKIKCGMEQEFVIIGWQPSDKAGRPFSSILLAVREEGELRYCGRVGTGFSGRLLDDLAARMKAHERKGAPVPNIPRPQARYAHFLEPVLVAEVEFRGWTREGLVRQGSFKGLREDKPANEVVREQPMGKAEATKTARRERAAASTKMAAKGQAPKKPAVRTRAAQSKARGAVAGKDEVEGVAITNPDRVLYAQQGITKRQLVDYYVAIADHMLPHIEGRPLALVRCPQGHEKECFFQKHASPGWPEAFGTIRIPEKTRFDQYMYVKDVGGLVAAAQMGVLELHIWGAHVPEFERPDRMVFDLDPDEGLDFARVKDGARELKSRLERIGLQSFPMVTGGKGVHVVVPLQPGHTWQQHRDFAEALARVMAEDSPERYVANMSKAKRRGKIYVDYMRNQRGSTAIAPFSTRARPGAHVALPVSWAALARLDNAHPVNIDTVVKLVSRRRDPWPDYHEVRQALPQAG